MPGISIISSAYNMESCFSFPESVRSILEQSFGDFEFIICNDGSSDKTGTMLFDFASRDSRIRIIENRENLGIAASLNRCAELARAPILARHDLDDISMKNRLEKQFSYMTANTDIALLGTQVNLFDENGVYARRNYPGRVTRRDFLFRCPYMHGSVMMRKDAFFKSGGYRVAKETRRTEDYDLFMRMADRGDGANLDEYLYCYCENKNTKKRRKYRYRIDEARVRYKGFKRLGLLPQGLPYVFKPLAVGLIPIPILEMIKNTYYRRESEKHNDQRKNN